jgi:hypothetical protein
MECNQSWNWNEVRSKAERCSEQDLQHTNNQRCEEPNISKEPNGQIIIDTEMIKEPMLGGKLNPNFVEFLMGYPMDWTKIEPTE